VLEVRKAYAFAGFTHKAPRAVTYMRADRAFDPEPEVPQPDAQRGRGTVRGPREPGKGRGLSV
jgi:protein-serine/threonine kinase